jgi:opacity protein-like surface antigen
MNKTRARSLGLLATGLLCSCFAQAQESVNSSGGDANGSGGSAAYSIGQIIYTTNTDASGTLSQGVQQAYEIFTIGIEEPEMAISLSVFPNPTSDNLTLEIGDYFDAKLSYQLMDIQGKLLDSKLIEAQQTRINMNSLPSATYFLNVVNQENKKIQSFEIIKH